jgi:IclR family KDG regulon transcriptional repressor
VKSAGRVLELFEYFAHRRSPATLSEVAGALGYPISSASVLLKFLHKLGYLEHDRRARVYVPTIRFSLLGMWIHEELFAEESGLLGMMDELRNATGETVSVGMQNDLAMQYLRILQSPEAIRYYIKPGTSRPICLSAHGKVLLSIQPEAGVNLLVRRHNGASDQVVSARQLIGELREIRKIGYAVSEGTFTPGGGSIGMLLPTAPGHRPLALGVGGPVERLRKNKKKILGMMQAAVAEYTSQGGVRSGRRASDER